MLGMVEKKELSRDLKNIIIMILLAGYFTIIYVTLYFSSIYFELLCCYKEFEVCNVHFQDSGTA